MPTDKTSEPSRPSRKLGRGLGNLIPVPLPPRDSEHREVPGSTGNDQPSGTTVRLAAPIPATIPATISAPKSASTSGRSSAPASGGTSAPVPASSAGGGRAAIPVSAPVARPITAATVSEASVKPKTPAPTAPEPSGGAGARAAAVSGPGATHKIVGGAVPPVPAERRTAPAPPLAPRATPEAAPGAARDHTTGHPSAASPGAAETTVSSVKTTEYNASNSDDASSYRVISISGITRNRWQPREMFHEEHIRELAESIESAGLMQPLVVRRVGKSYELIAGERRLRALQLLGRSTAPVVVHEVDDQTAAEWALIENLQREDLNPMERASALERLASEFNLTHEVLAGRLGLKRVTITNLLALNGLDAKCASLLRSGTITAGHAKALLSVSSVATRIHLAESCVKGDWSVRHLEREAKRIRERSTGNTRLPTTRSVSAHVADLERQLASHMGTKVQIQLGRKPNTGRIVMDFYSTAQFEGLTQQMGFEASGL